MRYVLKVAYDGTDFCGWQVQANARTVQGELNRAAGELFGGKYVFTASGRTDSGVHAAAQICHLDLEASIAADKLADALNTMLPKDVSVLASAAAPQGFDANRSAKKKTYIYRLRFSARRDPLKDRYSLLVKGSADVNKMREAASLFVGEHDFAAYCASGSQVKTTVRTIYSVDIEERGEEVAVAVCGNGFLYNMVRTLVGTLLWYAQDKMTLDDIKSTLTGKNREMVGKTLPACGLTLWDVDYGRELFN